MSDAPKNETSPPENDNGAALSKIEKLEREVQQITKLRKQRSIISAIGLGLMVLAIAIFIINIVSFVKNYDTDKLTEELGKNAALVAQGHETKMLVQQIQKEFVPAMKDALIAKFKEDMPKFQEEGEQVGRNLHLYLTEDVQAKLTEELSGNVLGFEREMLEKYPKITPEQVQSIMDETKVYFIEELTKSLERRLDGTSKDLASLHDSFSKITEDPEYQKLDPKQIGEIENKLIENLLLLIVYNLDPKKGDAPAVCDGSMERQQVKAKPVQKTSARGGVK